MRALALLAIVAAGCSSVELEPTTVKFRRGSGSSVRRVVAVRATCGSLSGFSREALARSMAQSQEEKQATAHLSDAVACTEKQLDGVDQLVRSALEFRGYSIVDSERVNAITAERVETITRDGGEESRREAVISGALFADAPPSLQDRILDELNAEGLLNARIFVGAPIARSPRRNVDVQVRLIDVESGELVWASRCRVNAGWDVDEVAIMQAARCAVERIEVRAR